MTFFDHDKKFVQCIAVSCLLLLLASCANQQTEQYNERLLAQPPASWQLVYQLNNPASRISEFIPTTEEPNTWRNKITFESNTTQADPLDILNFEVRSDQENCNFVQHFNIFSGLENNYPASVRFYLCGKNKFEKTGEVKMIKAIQGEEYIYLIKLERKLDAFEPNNPEFSAKETAAWTRYLKGVSVCNGTSNHPCASQPAS